MSNRYCYREVLPFAALVAVECSNVGTNILFVAATLQGLNFYVFVAYTFVISTFVLLPFLFLFRSSARLPSFNFSIVSRICLLGFTGFFATIFGYIGIAYSSPTLASAISNLSPAFTFILAIIFRMERLALRSASSQAKVIGTIVSILGASVVLFYKGPAVFSSESSVSLQLEPRSSLSNWLFGGFLLIVERLLLSIWFIVMTQVMKMYPAELIVVFLYSIIATIVAVPICLIAEPNLSSWILKPSVAIVAVGYSGFIELFINIVQAWSLHLKGPVYVAIFKPLSIVIAAVMSALFLGDALHLGSVIGGVIISIGFYAVIWGKAKEELTVDDESRPIMQKAQEELIVDDECRPILQSNKVVDM